MRKWTVLVTMYTILDVTENELKISSDEKSENARV